MQKFVLGFLLGALVASASFLLRPGFQTVSDAPTEPLTEPAANLRAASGSEPSNSPDVPSRQANRQEAPSQAAAAPASGGGAMLSLTDIDTPPVNVEREAVQARPAPGPADSYPPEIRDIVENDVNPELRQRYESDAREESWATYMEGQLQAYFASKPGLQAFNFSLIDCRTTVCAVHALGYGPDALTQWNIGTADIVNQPWHDFASMSVNRQNPQPDVLGIVLILTRRPP